LTLNSKLNLSGWGSYDYYGGMRPDALGCVNFHTWQRQD
jgi:hypothetical protein